MSLLGASALACSLLCAAPSTATAPEVDPVAPGRSYDGPGDVAATPEGGEPDSAGADAPADADAPDDTDVPALPTEDAALPDASSTVATAPPASGIAPTTWLRRHRFIYRNLVGYRVNPLGFVDELTLAYRLQLAMRDTRLLSDTFLLVGGHFFATPAFMRVGPTIELQPLAVLNFSATYNFVGVFGSFSQLQSFPSPASDWGPDHIGTYAHDGRNYRSKGHLVTLSGTFQFLVRKVAIRNNVRAFWQHMDLRAGDRVFYDQAIDLLVPQDGWSLTHDADALYLFDFGLRLAVRHTLTHAFYRARDFRPGEPVTQPNGPTLRVGPAVVHTFFDRPGVRFNKPTVFLLAQWWYRHRYRTGEQRSPAIPYFAIGFMFEGDLFPSRKDTELRRRRRRR